MKNGPRCWPGVLWLVSGRGSEGEDPVGFKSPGSSDRRDKGDAGLQDRLRLGDGWPRRWSSTWRVGVDEVCWPIRDMAHVPVLSSRPMRGFTWRAKQRHRPGLEGMASTGRQHGFESLEADLESALATWETIVSIPPKDTVRRWATTGGRVSGISCSRALARPFACGTAWRLWPSRRSRRGARADAPWGCRERLPGSG